MMKNKKPIYCRLLAMMLCFLMVWVAGACTLAPALETESSTTANTEQETEPETDPSSSGVIGEEPLPPMLTEGVDYASLLIASVYAGGGKIDAPIRNSYIELYNAGQTDIPLRGLSLYYAKTGSKAYAEFLLGEEGSIPAGTSYLIVGEEVEGYTGSDVYRITQSDATMSIDIDNSEFYLAVGAAGLQIAVDDDLSEESAIFPYLHALADDTIINTAHKVGNISKNKVIYLTAKTNVAAYDTVNLTTNKSIVLRAHVPHSSTGSDNCEVNSLYNEVYFDREAGFYAEGFRLSLSAPEGFTIYYTTDGSTPSIHATKYTESIAVENSSSMTWGQTITYGMQMMGNAIRPAAATLPGARVIRAIAYNGNEATDIYSSTYFVIPGLADTQATVINLSIDVADFIGPETGAYNIYRHNLWAPRPRSTGYLEIFSPDGQRQYGGYGEFAVSGNGSSGYAMKSLRFYLKSEMGGEINNPNKIEYDLFSGYARDAAGNPITSYRRFMIRNSGNDCGVTYLRDSFHQRMMADLICPTMAQQTALFFVNGEFWGMYNLREHYDAKYFNSHYGVAEENVVILENVSPLAGASYNSDYVVANGEAEDNQPFLDLVKYIRANDLSNQDVYNYVASQLDIDCFIDYWIAETFFCNHDWPGNNVKVWRNKNENDPSGVDTKWKYCILDTDMGSSFYIPGEATNTSETRNMFDSINEGTVSGSIMNHLRANREFCVKFACRAYEILEKYFTVEKLNQTLDEMIAITEPLYAWQLARWPSDFKGSYAAHYDRIYQFINNRGSIYLGQVSSAFGVSLSEMEAGATPRLTINPAPDKYDLTVNGELLTQNTVILLEENQIIAVRVLAKQGYLFSGMSFLGNDGTVLRFADPEATFTPTSSGTLTIYVKRESSGELQASASVTAGMDYVLYLDENGDLYGWGHNANGCLGLPGSTILTPTLIMQNVAKVETSRGLDNGQTNAATAILTKDGTLYTVGCNDSGQLGRSGDTTIPLPVNFSGAVKDMAMGYDHLLLLDEDGVLWGVGNNSYNQLGEGGATTTFVRIASDVKSIAAGRRNSMYVDSNDVLYALGDNRWNKVHTGSIDNMVTPYRVCENVAAVYGGEHQMLVLTNDGTLYYAGWRRFDTWQQTHSQPEKPNGILYVIADHVTTAEIQDYAVIFLDEEGKAYGFGYNNYGEITTNPAVCLTPAQITEGVMDVASGSGFSVFLMKDGRILVCGANHYGQAGNGTTSSRVTLSEVVFKK